MKHSYRIALESIDTSISGNEVHLLKAKGGGEYLKM